MGELLEKYLEYRIDNGEIKNFNEWLNAIENRMLYEEELKEFNENNEDLIEMENYYNNLCESVKVLINTNDKEEIEESEEAMTKYRKYKEKRIASGKNYVSFREWLKTQQRAKDLAYDFAKTGIKVAGVYGAAKVTSKLLKDKKLVIKSNGGSLEYKEKQH